MGDIYLTQEVLNRAGMPNRGNKSVSSYFGFLAAALACLDSPELALRAKACLPDLIVHS